MAGLWDEVKKVVKDGYVVAATKTEEYTKIGKIKFDILNIKRSIHKKFTEIGGKTHQLIIDDADVLVAADEDIKVLMADVLSLENEMKEKESIIDTIKEKE